MKRLYLRLLRWLLGRATNEADTPVESYFITTAGRVHPLAATASLTGYAVAAIVVTRREDIQHVEKLSRRMLTVPATEEAA
ncbi:hypothetical protein [Paraburkholderia sp. MM6662-R1]|uniref:hypothetical protein n=1 Tax=Paraburkholderia sp. MM6662-R1 TaxID=2991066 RepID=UPI003D22F574